jgi:adenylate cyclase
MNSDKTAHVIQSIINLALSGKDEPTLLGDVCHLLRDAGLPLLRFNISQPILHPVIGGNLFVWDRYSGQAKKESWDRNVNAANTSYTKSPFALLLNSGDKSFKCSLGNALDCRDFPMLENFRSTGATDYIALRTELGDNFNYGTSRFILTSWLTNTPLGFSQSNLDMIHRILPTLALVMKGFSAYRIGTAIIETYLGEEATKRIMAGAIERGAGESIRAVLWSADLQGFTRLSDTISRDELLNLLDDYFEKMVGIIHQFGGQILKFTGDGLLAIFKHRSDAENTCAALHAAQHLRNEISNIIQMRKSEGKPHTNLYLGLHLGDVYYGNVGSKDRLDFTVTGPAVNEVSRMEGMCRTLGRDIVISEAFAKHSDQENAELVELGEHQLRGVKEPQELFTLKGLNTLKC